MCVCIAQKLDGSRGSVSFMHSMLRAASKLTCLQRACHCLMSARECRKALLQHNFWLCQIHLAEVAGYSTVILSSMLQLR